MAKHVTLPSGRVLATSTQQSINQLGEQKTVSKGSRVRWLPVCYVDLAAVDDPVVSVPLGGGPHLPDRLDDTRSPPTPCMSLPAPGSVMASEATLSPAAMAGR